jgi:hypothetical protein
MMQHPLVHAPIVVDILGTGKLAVIIADHSGCIMAITVTGAIVSSKKNRT